MYIHKDCSSKFRSKYSSKLLLYLMRNLLGTDFMYHMHALEQKLFSLINNTLPTLKK